MHTLTERIGLVAAKDLQKSQIVVGDLQDYVVASVEPVDAPELQPPSTKWVKVTYENGEVETLSAWKQVRVRIEPYEF